MNIYIPTNNILEIILAIIALALVILFYYCSRKRSVWKIQMILTDKAYARLKKLSVRTGNTVPEVIFHALKLYDGAIEQAQMSEPGGGEVYFVTIYPDGTRGIEQRVFTQNDEEL